MFISIIIRICFGIHPNGIHHFTSISHIKNWFSSIKSQNNRVNNIFDLDKRWIFQNCKLYYFNFQTAVTIRFFSDEIKKKPPNVKRASRFILIALVRFTEIISQILICANHSLITNNIRTTIVFTWHFHNITCIEWRTLKTFSLAIFL